LHDGTRHDGLGSASSKGWLRGFGMVEGGLMMVAFWGVLIIGIVYFVRWITEKQRVAPAPAQQKTRRRSWAAAMRLGRSTSRPTSGYAWS
jgi:hypothetical protein